MKGDGCAAPVRGGTDLFDAAQGQPARELLREQLTIARHFNPEGVRQRVDHRNPHAVQAAGGLIGFAFEFAPRMKRAQDHLKRAFVGKLGVGINWYAAAIVPDGTGAIFMQLDLDPAGMARDSLVHRVVENLGHQMVQGTLIRAADIHTGAFAYRLQPLKHLDGGGVIGLLGGGAG